MKFLFYCIWGIISIVELLSILFNHYAEFYLDEHYVHLLFHEYSKPWAYTNMGITTVWLLFTWMGLYLLLKEDGQSSV